MVAVPALLRPAGPRPTWPQGTPTPRVVVLGAGAAGIAMTVRLKQAGIGTVTVLEKADALGGTWRDNSYPGSGCDVPSHLYSFSFATKHDWSRKYAKQPEILAYLTDVAERFDVVRHLRLGVTVEAVERDEAEGVWRVRLADGETVTADVVISATGQLNAPVVPEIEGTDDFAGTVFHTARWRHDHDLVDRDVAVVGTGASVIQIVPAIADTVRSLTIFQRSPAYVIAKPDRAFRSWEQSAFAHLPGADKAYRAWLYAKMDVRFVGFTQTNAVTDTVGGWLLKWYTRVSRSITIDGVPQEAITPDYPVGCKRLLISNDYYDTLAKPNVTMVTSGIERITAGGVRDRSGVEHPADTLVWGTGFDALNFLAGIEVTGTAGEKLSDVWAEGAEAYLGLAVPGFPNFFLLYGPNTNLGHSSILFMVERAADYVVALLAEMGRTGARTAEVRTAAHRTFSADVQERMAQTAWVGNCTSWYKTAAGRITNNWPGFTTQYWWRTRRRRAQDWSLR